MKVRYCSRECQQHHWKNGHKIECSKMQTAKQENEDSKKENKPE